MCIHVDVSVCTQRPEGALDHLELELQVVVTSHLTLEPNSYPLEKQQALLTTKLSL